MFVDSIDLSLKWDIPVNELHWQGFWRQRRKELTEEEVLTVCAQACLRRQVEGQGLRGFDGWRDDGDRMNGAPQTQLAVTSMLEMCGHPRNRERGISGWVCEKGRGRKRRLTECLREGKSEGGRPSVYSQCCDRFVMFPQQGDSQTVCFHFIVWYLPLTVKM